MHSSQENRIKDLFIKFITEEKGFKSENLIDEFTIVNEKGNGIYKADLMILNPTLEFYLGLVEFKSEINSTVKENTFIKVNKYLKLLNDKVIPAYLVSAEEDIIIYEFDRENKWIKIEKNAFPNFTELTAHRILFDTREKKTQKENKVKRENKERFITKFTTSIAAIGVLIALTTLFTDSLFVDKNPSKLNIADNRIFHLIDSLNSEIKKNRQTFNNMIDSLTIQKSTVDSLFFEINHLEPLDLESNIQQKLFLVQSTLITLNKKQDSLGKMISNIENIIIDDPNKILTIPILKKDIESNQQKIDTELNLMKKDISYIKEDLNSYSSAGTTFLISISVAMISLIIGNYYRSKKKD